VVYKDWNCQDVVSWTQLGGEKEKKRKETEVSMLLMSVVVAGTVCLSYGTFVSHSVNAPGDERHFRD
jgi:hypothetical protein